MIDNAVKYSPVNKEIQVTIKALEDEMLVQVQDNGEGISKEDINHIFERFYRSDKARNRTTTQSGVGIGLSILYQIVELIAAVLMLVLNLVLEHVSTFTFHLRMEKRRHLNLSFKSIYKRLRVILGHEHASFRACFLCVFMVK